jgi:hypothetical protein
VGDNLHSRRTSQSFQVNETIGSGSMRSGEGIGLNFLHTWDDDVHFRGHDDHVCLRCYGNYIGIDIGHPYLKEYQRLLE